MMQSALEKLGVDVHPAAVTDAPGRDWAWVIGHFEGREFWGNAERVRVRRKAWPVALFKKGLRLPAGDGETSTVAADFTSIWHVWWDDTWARSKFPIVDGLCQGFGGSLGADHDDDDYVVVCGHREHDGTGYRPSADDLVATDWELLAINAQGERSE